jgi:hypothetical protein
MRTEAFQPTLMATLLKTRLFFWNGRGGRNANKRAVRVNKPRLSNPQVQRLAPPYVLPQHYKQFAGQCVTPLHA